MKTLLTIILLMIYSLVIQAQQVFNSLNEVWAYSLSSNPENTIYQLRIEQAKQDKKTANSYLYPKLTAGFSGQNNINIPETPVPGELMGKPGETVYLQFGQNYNYNSGLTLSKTLLDWQSAVQAKIAKLNVSLNEAQQDYFKQTLKEQVAQNYYAVLMAKKAVEISSRDFAIVDSIFLIAKECFDQGFIDGLVFNQAKVNKNNVSEKLEKNKLYQSQWIYNIKSLLGFTASDSLIFTEDISLGDDPEQIDNLNSNEKYSRIYKLQSEISNAESRKAIARFSPKIDMTYYYGAIQYQNNFTLSFNSSDWRPNSYLGLSVSLPIFTGFSNTTRYNSAKISETIAQQRFQDEVRKSDINDNILLANYLSSLKSLQITSETYKVLNNSLELVSQKYKQGLISLDEYLNVFEDYLSAENQYFNSLSDYLINKATVKARKENNTK